MGREDEGPTDHLVEMTYLGRSVLGRGHLVEVDWDGIEDRWYRRHGDEYMSPETVLERSSDLVEERLTDSLGVRVFSVSDRGVQLSGGEEEFDEETVTEALEDALERVRYRLL